MRYRSSSSPSRSAALALLLLLGPGSCAAESVGDGVDLDLHVDQPGGLGFEVRVTGRRRDELYLDLHAGLTNLGADPCHVAVFLHAAEPVPADMPSLTGPPAPVIADAQLMFETVLAPPSGGREFTRRLDFAPLIVEALEASGERRRWLTIATCEAPDLQVELTLGLHLQYLVRRGGERSATLDQIWP